MPIKNITREEFDARIHKLNGYSVSGAYVSTVVDVRCYCPKHDHYQIAKPTHMLRGFKLSCCTSSPKRPGQKLSHEEARQRFAAGGYELLSEYERSTQKVLARCTVHDYQAMVFPGNIFKGQQMKCCGCRAISNARTGMKFSEETKQKLSLYRGERHHGFGKALSEITKEKVSGSVKRKHETDHEYAVTRAAQGKTSGKPGWFYIVKVGGNLLKFGSVSKTSVKQRIKQIGRKYGDAVLLLKVQVADAGSYEAAMIDRYKQYWAHSEFFHDFRTQVTPREAMQ